MVVSLLRRSASSMIDRARALRLASRAGVRLARSVSSVAPASMMPPTSASIPSQGWIRPQMSEKHRDPRQIDDRDRALPGQESPDLIEVADRFVHFAGLPAGGRQPDDRPMHDGRKVLVEKSGRARHHAAADQVHHCLKHKGAAEQDRQRDEGGNAVARQHPVIDLEHVEGPGEHQQVHHGREQGHAPERPAAVLEGRRNGGMRHCARGAGGDERRIMAGSE